MRLLSPQDQKAKEKEEESAKKHRLDEILSYLNRAEKALNEFKEHDRAERERISKEHAMLVQSHEGKIDQLTSEVKELEARREAALLPIKDRERAVAERETNAITRELELDTRESKLVEREEAVNKLYSKCAENLAIIEKDNQNRAAREKKIDDRRRHQESIIAFKEQRLRGEKDRVRQLIEELDQKSKSLNKQS